MSRDNRFSGITDFLFPTRFSKFNSTDGLSVATINAFNKLHSVSSILFTRIKIVALITKFLGEVRITDGQKMGSQFSNGDLAHLCGQHAEDCTNAKRAHDTVVFHDHWWNLHIVVPNRRMGNEGHQLHSNQNGG